VKDDVDESKDGTGREDNGCRKIAVGLVQTTCSSVLRIDVFSTTRLFVCRERWESKYEAKAGRKCTIGDTHVPKALQD